jgi:hypothetical protein
MGSSLDALNAPSSLTNRRPAAATLPTFELPAPPAFPMLNPHKYPSYSHTIQHPSTAAVSVGNLLTPPSNSASDTSAASSAIPTGSTPNSGPAPVLPYTPTFFNQATTPGFHTGLTPQWNPNPLMSSRNMFSPPTQPLYRPHTASPTAGEASSLPPPPYEISAASAYGMQMGMASPPGASLASQPMLSNPMVPIRPPSQPTHTTLAEVLPSKPASAPSLYTNLPPANTPASAHSYHGSTPVSQSPYSAPPQRQSPPIPSSAVPSNNFIRPPYPSYSLPAMPGPAMTNLHSPGSQMAMVGQHNGMLPMTFNSGYAAHPHAGIYGQQRTQSPAQAAQNDRPFRCDSCPQSFHRNHDLKRHKRIHLAVKPFPCPYCDKSFSRKDALKVCRPLPVSKALLTSSQRHKLVKGCGSKADAAARDEASKSDSGSSDHVDDGSGAMGH